MRVTRSDITAAYALSLMARQGQKADPSKTDAKQRRQQLVDFGAALKAARKAAGLTQEQLEKRTPWNQSTISGWESPNPDRERAEVISPEIVFRLESEIGVKPGVLSRHLGFLPVTAVRVSTSVEEAVADDAYLDKAEKDAILRVYDGFVKDRRPSRSRTR